MLSLERAHHVEETCFHGERRLSLCRAVRRLTRSREGHPFGCGNRLLNRWLARYTGRSERRDDARIVATDPRRAVLGYYTLLAGQLQHEAATASVRNGQSSHFPIPIALLGRLAAL